MMHGRRGSVRLWTMVLLAIVCVHLTLQVAGRMFTIPLIRSVDENKRAAVLMKLKEKLHYALLETSSQVEASTGDKTQSKEVPLNVEILSTKHLATYFGVIEIQGTKFKVLFDTGSCEFWVPSTACNTLRCRRHSRLPLSQNRRIASLNGMNIQYLSGRVEGDMVYETVKLGDVTVENQVVGVAKVVDIELLDDVKWDGILGLAYPNPTLSAEGITPIFDTIINSRVLTNKHLSNQFAYYIDDTKGAVTFGGADCDLIGLGSDKRGCVDKFQFVSVTEKTYWTIRINDVKVTYPGGHTKSGFCGPSGCKAIVDTGTYLIYGPQTQVTQMLTTELHSCAHHTEMPDFTFEFFSRDGRPVSVTLKPIDYILKFKMGSKADCVVGISPDQDTIWTLGQVFLRSFYTVFDRDEDRIGFARLPRTGFKALNSKATMHALKKRRTALVEEAENEEREADAAANQDTSSAHAESQANVHITEVQQNQQKGMLTEQQHRSSRRGFDGLRHLAYN